MERPDMITLPAREKKCLLFNFAKNVGKAINKIPATPAASHLVK